MKNILKLIFASILVFGIYKFYLYKNTVDQIKDSKKEKLEAIEDLKLLKKTKDHFEPSNLKNIKKYSNMEGFKVGPFVLELKLVNDSFITINIYNSKNELVTPSSLDKLNLVIDRKAYELINVSNGIVTTKIIKNKEKINEITIWGKYKNRTFSAKQSFNFIKKSSI